MTTQIEEIKNLLRATYRNLIECLSGDPGESLKDQVDFYNDPETVVYWITTASNSVMCADKENLLLDGNPLQYWLVNKEILSTYLSSNDLGLVVALSGEMDSGIVGAFDRSTGLGLYNANDWFDEDRIRNEAALSSVNKAFPMEYVEVVQPGIDATSPGSIRSVVRMRNLLADCRSHQLTTACGFEIQLTDAES
jgi:hypothetical protein